MTKQIEIQERITITEDEFNETLNFYKRVPKGWCIGINEVSLDKKGIIKEIKNLTKTGKMILLLRHNFNKWISEQEKCRGDEEKGEQNG